jgi:hypothetical protein
MKNYLLSLFIIVFLFVDLIFLPNFGGILSVLVIELIFLIYVNHICKSHMEKIIKNPKK